LFIHTFKMHLTVNKVIMFNMVFVMIEIIDGKKLVIR